MTWFTVILVLLFLQGLVLSVFVLLESRHPMATLSWVLTLCLLPLLGAVLYYFFGRRRFYRRQRLRSRALEPLLKAHQSRNPLPAPEDSEVVALSKAVANVSALSALPPKQPKPAKKHKRPTPPQEITEDHKEGAPPPAARFRPKVLPESQRDSMPVIDLAARIIPAPLTDDNAVYVLHNGEATYAAIERAIRAAKHHIHVLYYIVREDQTGRWLRDLLIERAKEGLEVRFLYDAIGCYGTSSMFFQPMRDAGVKVAEFMPVRLGWPLRKSYLNFRNHRKLVVVDGHIGFTGGINIGDEYQGKHPDFGHWRDDHLHIDGPAVHYLQHVFAEDWCHVTDELLAAPAYFPFEELSPAETTSNHPGDATSQESLQPDAEPLANDSRSRQQKELVRTYVDSDAHKAMLQIVPSGPDQSWYPIRLLFFAAIASAREQVWMTTPYFVPDGAILTAIITSALRGVDVRLLLPAKGDNPLVRLAGRSYYRRLLQAGVKIYEYQQGMLHAKTMVVDHHYGTIGSANLDMRSFHINFEINAFAYDDVFAKQIEHQFIEDLKDAVEIDRIAFSKRPIRQRLLEAGARIFSPLL